MKPPRILIVEDDGMLQAVVRGMSDHFGYDVVVVETCQMGLELFSREVFDMVFMDWQLTGTDGLECAGVLRQLEKSESKRTPIVAMTANVMKGHRELALAAGMDDFLAKPFSMAEFKSMVEKFCS
jgi:two-component system, sensor histidine kinase and response regulator